MAAVTREQQLVNDRKIAHEAAAVARADAEKRATEEVSKSDASNVNMVIFKQRRSPDRNVSWSGAVSGGKRIRTRTRTVTFHPAWGDSRAW